MILKKRLILISGLFFLLISIGIVLASSHIPQLTSLQAKLCAVGGPCPPPFRGRIPIPFHIPGNVLELDTARNLTYDGVLKDTTSGVDVAVGDLNDDGSNDLIIGAPNDSDSMTYVYIIYGPLPNGPARFNISSVVNVTINGTGERLGRGFEAGDLNNDGIDDLAIGALWGKSSQGVEKSGKIYVVYGPLGNGVFNRSIEQIANLSILGKDDSKLGSGIGIGDLNGDGVNDIAMGATRADPEGRTDAGETYVVYGPLPNGFNQEFNLVNIVNVTFNGINNSDFSGNDLTISTLNPGAIDDIAIGATLADPEGRTNAGEVYVIFGPLPNGFNQTFNISSRVNITIQGNKTGDFLGTGVDVWNHDAGARTKLVLGARGADPDGRTEAGEVYTLWVLPTENRKRNITDIDTTHFILRGIDDNDRVGDGLDSGTLNSDGVEDLVVGAFGGDPDGRTDAGETYVVHGPR